MSDAAYVKLNSSVRPLAALLWRGLLSALLLWGGMSILSGALDPYAPDPLLPALAALAAWVLCELADHARRLPVRLALRVLPWPLLVLALGVDQVALGIQFWFNCVLSRWNEVHASGLSLFTAGATEQSILAACAAMSFALGELAHWLISRRVLPVIGILTWVAILIPLHLDWGVPRTCGLIAAVFLGSWMSGPQNRPSRQTVRFWAVCLLLLTVGIRFLPQGELSTATRLREDTLETIHTLRYGPDLLPLGHLDQAAKLDGDDTPLLSLRTGQEKALYLRGFVGSNYKDGVWTPTTGAEYSGNYRGLLSWLRSQDFDPLTQSAKYYALCDPKDAPEPNHVNIRNSGASRAFLYAPASTRSISLSTSVNDYVASKIPGEVRDQRFSPSRLLGVRSYTLDEVSSPRPAELTVRADWVSSPETEEQQRYVDAEAQYRNFVYERYTTPDSDLLPLLNQVFWSDYQPQHESIYGALDRIRTTLRTRTTYVRDPAPSDAEADPIADLLIGSRQGNAALYASAAVQALRSRGIPARYVEGYYLSADGAAAGAVTLTGNNAHAWAEVYFDGIGWLPVDVTPGYYYDAVTLQQMVALPDTVRKTAALNNDPDSQGSEVTKDHDAAGGLPQPIAQAVRTTLVVLGIAALAALVCAALFALLELLRLLAVCAARRRFRRAEPVEQTDLLRQWIFRALALWHIDACLGWQSEQTDETIARRFPTIAPGEYCRAVTLMEKVRYGGVAPEPYELRTLQDLAQRLYLAARPVFQLTYWKLRYCWLAAAVRK